MKYKQLPDAAVGQISEALDHLHEEHDFVTQSDVAAFISTKFNVDYDKRGIASYLKHFADQRGYGIRGLQRDLTGGYEYALIIVDF